MINFIKNLLYLYYYLFNKKTLFLLAFYDNNIKIITKILKNKKYIRKLKYSIFHFLFCVELEKICFKYIDDFKYNKIMILVLQNFYLEDISYVILLNSAIKYNNIEIINFILSKKNKINKYYINDIFLFLSKNNKYDIIKIFLSYKYIYDYIPQNIRNKYIPNYNPKNLIYDS
jgi:hypothetical protein